APRRPSLPAPRRPSPPAPRRPSLPAPHPTPRPVFLLPSRFAARSSARVSPSLPWHWGSVAWSGVCAAQVSPSLLVSPCVCPVCGRALQRCARVTRHLQGRQIRIEADELELREDPDQPSRQTRWPAGRSVAAKQA